MMIFLTYPPFHDIFRKALDLIDIKLSIITFSILSFHLAFELFLSLGADSLGRHSFSLHCKQDTDNSPFHFQHTSQGSLCKCFSHSISALLGVSDPGCTFHHSDHTPSDKNSKLD